MRSLLLIPVVVLALVLAPSSSTSVVIQNPYPLSVVRISSTGVIAAFGATNLIASSPAASYSVSGYSQVTTVSVGACQVNSTMGYTYNGIAKTGAIVSSLTGNVANSSKSGSTVMFRSDAATAVTYDLVFTGGVNCNNLVLDLYVVLERTQ